MNHNTAPVSLAALQEVFFFDVGSLYEHLENLKDRRDPRGVRYPLAIALVFIILAKLAGEQEPRGIAQWVALRKDLLREVLRFDRDATPDGEVGFRLIARRLHDRDVRRKALKAPDVRDVACLEGSRAERCHCDRHVAQLFFAALGGDDNLFQSARSLRRWACCSLGVSRRDRPERNG